MKKIILIATILTLGLLTVGCVDEESEDTVAISTYTHSPTPTQTAAYLKQIDYVEAVSGRKKALDAGARICNDQAKTKGSQYRKVLDETTASAERQVIVDIHNASLTQLCPQLKAEV